jgi:hypothetical protein
MLPATRSDLISTQAAVPSQAREPETPCQLAMMQTEIRANADLTACLKTDTAAARSEIILFFVSAPPRHQPAHLQGHSRVKNAKPVTTIARVNHAISMMYQSAHPQRQQPRRRQHQCSCTRLLKQPRPRFAAFSHTFLAWRAISFEHRQRRLT